MRRKTLPQHGSERPSPFQLKRLPCPVDDNGEAIVRPSSYITTWRLSGSLRGIAYRINFDSHPISQGTHISEYDDNPVICGSAFVRDDVVSMLRDDPLVTSNAILDLSRLPCFVIDIDETDIDTPACLKAFDTIYHRMHRTMMNDWYGTYALALLWVPEIFSGDILTAAGWMIMQGEYHCAVGMLNEGKRQPLHLRSQN